MMDKDKKRVTWQCGCRDHGGVMVQQWVPGDLNSVNEELLGVLMEVLEDGLKTNMIDWQRRANTAVTKAMWESKNKD